MLGRTMRNCRRTVVCSPWTQIDNEMLRLGSVFGRSSSSWLFDGSSVLTYNTVPLSLTFRLFSSFSVFVFVSVCLSVCLSAAERGRVANRQSRWPRDKERKRERKTENGQSGFAGQSSRPRSYCNSFMCKRSDDDDDALICDNKRPLFTIATPRTGVSNWEAGLWPRLKLKDNTKDSSLY